MFLLYTCVTGHLVLLSPACPRWHSLLQGLSMYFCQCDYSDMAETPGPRFFGNIFVLIINGMSSLLELEDCFFMGIHIQLALLQLCYCRLENIKQLMR